ncbi:helix-turn-helix domain-containing protein [uncultured Shewanella sp.]|uniref:helix-turn-helix domain-containing protein n=1 Tax=uncultured Shewanella sp. TaxID=173975 RepID=UPI00261EF92E|nr:helix-turn-helix domain-containing protein [uncultured Shewanella sp.]
MDIGEVSKQTKLSTSTLRYYEEKGLITSIGRNGLRRVYAPNVIERLALITLGRNAGLSLHEIANMFLTPKDMPLTANKINIDRQVLLAKANELDIKINEMTAMRDGLRHAAACRAKHHLDCPKFLRILNIASKRWSNPQHKLNKS